MARHRGPVLVDTNVIIECWRVSAWRALTGGYQVETVQMCEIETQTGLQRRRREQQIDAAELRSSLKATHAVPDHERATALLRDHQFAFLDAASKCCGRTRLPAMTRGCCVGRTRRACAWACGL